MTGAPAKEAAVMIGEVERAGIDETCGACRDDATAARDPVAAAEAASVAVQNLT